ncbi:MAG: adenine deaminase [Flavobacteriales bacterium]|nr:adenine deaminase [Flavobacteriales bacterium]
MTSFSLRTNLVDIAGREVRAVELLVENGRITAIKPFEGPVEGYLIPGFVDAHVHVESSMLLPSEFARLAVTHGTVATVSDPHEIANVLGAEGVDFMITNGRQVPFHFFFGAPSCVPATAFETAGAALDSEAVGRLLERPEVRYLSEMMNFPGVLHGDAEVMRKIAHAHRLGKPVDGHAPGLRGADVVRYAAAGITTDHECFTLEEALDKLAAGMWVQIREGSAAKNFEALWPLLNAHPHRVMLCSDDKHPDGLVEGHINDLCRRAVALGVDVFNVLLAACINPRDHYTLPIGRLRVGDPADMVLLDDLVDFRAVRTWIGGRLVAEHGETLIPRVHDATPNRFRCSPVRPTDLRVPSTGPERTVIGALDGQLITNRLRMPEHAVDGASMSDTARDVLKLVVVDRYTDRHKAVAWVHGFGLKHGAIAGSVAHDSHNIVAVGCTDEDLCEAINAVIAHQGGVSVAHGGTHRVLPLPVAGLMSDADAYTVADAYSALDREAKALGSTLSAPFMTLSFMALLVIPHLKLSDRGLFDVDSFSFA